MIGNNKEEYNMVEQYNNIFSLLSKKSVLSQQELQEVNVGIKALKSLKANSKDIERLENKFKMKIEESIESNEDTYNMLQKNYKSIKSKIYIENTTEQEERDTNSYTLRLATNLSNDKVKNSLLLEQTIKDRIGALSVLKVSRLQGYESKIPSRIINLALECSKSEKEKLFQVNKENNLADIVQQLSSAYSTGFGVRNLYKSLKKESLQQNDYYTKKPSNELFKQSTAIGKDNTP